MKLTQNQIIVMTELSRVSWTTAYEIQMSRNTLEALVRKGLVEKRGAGFVGSIFTPRTTIQYRVIASTSENVEVDCPFCRGRGGEGVDLSDHIPCPQCEGTGKITPKSG
jgi:hypothetical protein